MVLVAAITLAFAYGTDYDFTTSGLVPTACVTCVLLIGAFRAAYDSFTVELQRLLRARTRVLLVGEGKSLAALQRVLAAARGALAYEFVGTFVPRRGELLASRIERDRPHEVILNEGDFDEQTVLEIVEVAHRAGVKVRLAPRTTELLVQRGEYVPGQGVPLFELRPPILAGADWAVKRAFDLVVSGIIVLVGLPLWLLIAAAIKLDSPRARALPRPPDRGRRARVRDAQVQDDGAGRGRAAGRARGAERGAGGAVQDPRRPARHARRQGSCASSRSTSCRRS